MTTWIAIAIAGGATAWLFCLHIRPYLGPLEGVQKVTFVIGCWWGGAGLVIGAHAIHYWLACLLAGLTLLILGTWQGLPPILRWYRERPYWKAMERTPQRESKPAPRTKEVREVTTETARG